MHGAGKSSLYTKMYVQYGGKWMEQASQVCSLTNQDMSADT
jgi:hypothetical protein